LNDCWPAPTWSSIDYFGNWKALHYRIKRDYEDVAVVSKFTDEGVQEFYMVSDQPDTFNLEVNYVIFNLDGEELHRGKFNKQIGGLMKERICHSCLEAKLNNENWVIEFSWNDPQNVLHKRTFSHLPRPVKKASEKDVSLTFEKNPDGTLDAVITTSKFLRDFWLYASTPAVGFGENFIDILPGKHKIRVEQPANSTGIPEFNCRWR
jgi:beta-mannosidase